MNTKRKFYVRVAMHDTEAMISHMERNKIEWVLLSRDSVKGDATALFSLNLTSEEATALTLSFKLRGCLDFTKALGRLITKQSVDHSL
jgi:hypothetical protein